MPTPSVESHFIGQPSRPRHAALQEKLYGSREDLERTTHFVSNLVLQVWFAANAKKNRTTPPSLPLVPNAETQADQLMIQNMGFPHGFFLHWWYFFRTMCTIWSPTASSYREFLTANRLQKLAHGRQWQPANEPDRDRLFRLRPVLDQLFPKFQEVFEPGREIAIDESLQPVTVERQIGFHALRIVPTSHKPVFTHSE